MYRLVVVNRPRIAVNRAQVHSPLAQPREERRGRHHLGCQRGELAGCIGEPNAELGDVDLRSDMRG